MTPIVCEIRLHARGEMGWEGWRGECSEFDRKVSCAGCQVSGKDAECRTPEGRDQKSEKQLPVLISQLSVRTRTVAEDLLVSA